MVHTRIVRLQDGYSLLKIGDRLALMYRVLKRPGKGGRKDKIQCVYFGFATEAEASQFLHYLKSKFKGVWASMREGQRLDCAWEVKVNEFPELHTVVRACLHKAAVEQQQSVA